VKLGGHDASEVTYISSSTLRAVEAVQSVSGDTITITNPDGRTVAFAGIPQANSAGRQVSALDLSIVMSRIGKHDTRADYSQDGIVDAADMAVIMTDWTW
jgi:hypothetical protein